MTVGTKGKVRFFLYPNGLPWKNLNHEDFGNLIPVSPFMKFTEFKSIFPKNRLLYHKNPVAVMRNSTYYSFFGFYISLVWAEGEL